MSVGGYQRVRVKKVTPFAEWLRDMLTGLGLSYSEFARRGDLGGAAVVSRWASGEAKPSIEMCRKVAIALSVDLDFVLEKAGYRDPGLTGETSERGGVLASMVKRVQWDDVRYNMVYGIIAGLLKEDRARSAVSGT